VTPSADFLPEATQSPLVLG